ncbi:uncharacterized protein [Palaemon carinicauda]|uniref:uncharacterized protein n=1 Tax=Palaemon carinicauda TaxID=392227 RepID=UPI0035B5FC37
MDQITHVKNICTSWLKPLRVLSNHGNGVGIPILRSVYLATLRSIIDYSAPVLCSFSDKDLRPLELLQNEAMRVILGCPRTARIEIMRLELNFPSVTQRIRELTVSSIIRLIRQNDRHFKIIINRYVTGVPGFFPLNEYSRKLCKVLNDYNVLDFCVPLPSSRPIKPWITEKVDISIEQLDLRKRDNNSLELKHLVLENISRYSKDTVIHAYCDGSVTGCRAGLGVVIREFFEFGYSTEERISKRIGDHSSSTTAELFAIYECLKFGIDKEKSILCFVDSQSVLLALNAKLPSGEEIVTKCNEYISIIKGSGYSVKFVWIPSHCGIYFNDVAVELAKQLCNKESIDYATSVSMRKMKSHMARVREGWNIENAKTIMSNGSNSVSHYDYVSNNTRFTYGNSSVKCDGIVMRLKQGYKYYWEYKSGEGTACKLCDAANSHTLQHYIMECSSLAEFRNLDNDFQQMRPNPLSIKARTEEGQAMATDDSSDKPIGSPIPLSIQARTKEGQAMAADDSADKPIGIPNPPLRPS